MIIANKQWSRLGYKYRQEMKHLPVVKIREKMRLRETIVRDQGDCQLVSCSL